MILIEQQFWKMRRWWNYTACSLNTRFELQPHLCLIKYFYDNIGRIYIYNLKMDQHGLLRPKNSLRTHAATPHSRPFWAAVQSKVDGKMPYKFGVKWNLSQSAGYYLTSEQKSETNLWNYHCWRETQVQSQRYRYLIMCLFFFSRLWAVESCCFCVYEICDVFLLYFYLTWNLMSTHAAKENVSLVLTHKSSEGIDQPTTPNWYQMQGASAFDEQGGPY